MTDTDTRVEGIILASAEAFSDRVAVIDREGPCTYRDLGLLARQVRDGAHRAGMPEGATVGISLSTARDFLAATFGVLQARSTVIPIAPNLSHAERDRLIVDTGVSWLIDSISGERASLCGEVHPIKGTSLRLICLRDTGCSLVRDLFPDAAVIRYTSGTTARSKGVVLSHRGVLERTEVSRRLLDVREGDVVIAPLPLSYHFIASALSFVRAGATLLDTSDFTVSEMVSMAREHRATMMYGSPVQYELMARAARTHQLPPLRRAISTAALLSSATAESFFAAFRCRLTQVYGIIEIGLPLWNDNDAFRPSSLGACKSPYECAVVSETGVSVRPGEVGELLLRGPGSFSGYLVGGGAGVPRKPDSWFSTGDLVTRGVHGEITYKGRTKSVLNCGGHKIFPEEVEAVLGRIPGIQGVRVVSEPHQLLGNVVVAEVVVDPRSKPTVDVWRATCYRELSVYKVPKEFRIVPSLPTTGSGKVMRHSLVEESVSS